MPATGTYLRRYGDTGLPAVQARRRPARRAAAEIAEITTFGPARFPILGLPDTL